MRARVVIVSCPACATRFSLDASLLGPSGRNVRCAKCGHRWRQEAPAPIEPLPTVEPVTLEPEPQMAPGLAALLGGARDAKAAAAATVVVPPKLRPAQPKRKVGAWPWILLLGILCGLAVAAYIYQGPIARMFPATQSIYQWLGFGESDPAIELKIGNLKSEQRSGFLAVRGDIFNPTDYPMKVPPLLLTAQDANGAPLGTGLMFRTQEAEIAPGETITFRMPFEDRPKGMKGFTVTFGRLDRK
jgi:predicted Zn finger-like uncharacterized protein